MRACSKPGSRLGMHLRKIMLEAAVGRNSFHLQQEVQGLDMSGCQNYGPFLGPYYNTAPII